MLTIKDVDGNEYAVKSIWLFSEWRVVFMDAYRAWHELPRECFNKSEWEKIKNYDGEDLDQEEVPPGL